MRLDINAGGLSRFMSGVSLFVNTSSSSSTSKRLIDGLQDIVNKTNSLTGGAGNLGTAASLINARRLKEEQRRNIINTVRTRTNNFISTAVAVDNQVAAMVEKSTEQFYQTNPWLRSPVPPSLRERVRNGLSRFWDGVKETAANVWNSVVDFVKENWKEIVIAIGVVLLVVLTLGKAAPLLVLAAKKIGLAAKVIKITSVTKTKMRAICAAVNAVAEVGKQFVSDLITSAINREWSFSSWESYAASAFGGAVEGLAFTYRIRGRSGQALGASAKHLAQQYLELHTGRREKFSIFELIGGTIVDVSIASALESIQITGINQGSHSLEANYNRVIRRIINNNASNITGTTLVNGFMSQFISGIPDAVIGGIRDSNFINDLRDNITKGVKNTEFSRTVIQNIYIPHPLIIPSLIRPFAFSF